MWKTNSEFCYFYNGAKELQAGQQTKLQGIKIFEKDCDRNKRGDATTGGRKVTALQELESSGISESVLRQHATLIKISSIVSTYVRSSKLHRVRDGAIESKPNQKKSYTY